MTDSDSGDYPYENPPLIEVIAEIHWQLTPLQMGPGTSIDPHFNFFSEQFVTACQSKGFGVQEHVVSANVPLELLGHQVIRRFRSAANAWPLFQIGPGIVTVNIVPPYNGWAEFFPYIQSAIQMLYDSYPMPDRYLTIESMELKYIDAFTEQHGVGDRSSFIRKDLGMVCELPQSVRDLATGGHESIQQTGAAVLELANPANTTASLTVENGAALDRPAVIATFRARSKGDHLRGIRPDFIASWFGDAHQIVKKWFEETLSQRVKESMGKIEALR